MLQVKFEIFLIILNLLSVMRDSILDSILNSLFSILDSWFAQESRIANRVENRDLRWTDCQLTFEWYCRLILNLLCLLALIIHELGLGNKGNWESTYIKKFNLKSNLPCYIDRCLVRMLLLWIVFPVPPVWYQCKGNKNWQFDETARTDSLV